MTYDLTAATASLVVSVGPFHRPRGPLELELTSDHHTVSLRLTPDQLAVLYVALDDFLAGNC
jgi:hypothetical protein